MLTYTYRYNRVIKWFQDHPVSRETQYCESHHIVPRSMNGIDDKSNLVLLPGRWHYIVHCWLPFVYLEQNNHVGYIKMLNAWERMITGAKYTEEKFKSYNIKKDSKEYLKLRKLANESTSKKQKEYHRIHGSAVKDSFWITDPKTHKTKMVHSESEIPEGWQKGRLTLKDTIWVTNLSTRTRMIIKKTDPVPEGYVIGDKIYSEEIWITNGKTNTRIKKNDPIPKGWIQGRTTHFTEESKRRSSEKAKLTHRTTLKITNGIETIRIPKEQPIPEGYNIVPRKIPSIKGPIGLKYITNGTVNKQHDPKNPLPEGFHYGITKPYKGKLICITNGIVNRYILETDTIPNGFYRGSHLKSILNKIFINNGQEVKTINKNEPIPEGWKRGTGLRKNKQKAC